MKESEKFEIKLKKLETIVEKLESENLGIEETLKFFQEGIELGKECKKILDDIEFKVQKVLNESNDNLQTGALDDGI
mgnify:CR=1 FL=1|jgi:exodeoxyribonuclease VII small subunit